MVKYSIPIPSENKPDMVDELQMLKDITDHLNELLESLLKLGEDELVPDWQLPLADKDITNNITKLVQRIKKLEELKGRVQDLPKSIQIPAAKQEKKKRASPVSSSHRDPKAILEGENDIDLFPCFGMQNGLSQHFYSYLVMKHGTEDVVSMTHAFENDLTPHTG
ncbi:unnamed protein product [Caretta caretta]